MGNAGYWLKSSKFFDSTSLDNKQSSNGLRKLFKSKSNIKDDADDDDQSLELGAVGRRKVQGRLN